MNIKSSYTENTHCQFLRKSAPLVLILLGTLFTADPLPAQENVANDWKVTQAGQIRQVILNRGSINDDISDYPGLMDTEFPPGSGVEHLGYAGIWVGAEIPNGEKRVTVGESQTGYGFESEMWPTSAEWDTIWVVNPISGPDGIDIGGTTEDGSTEVYLPDYKPLSDQDFVCRYNDYNILTPVVGSGNAQPHDPLYIDIIQKTYTWSAGTALDKVIVWNYEIIPTKFDLENMYFTLELDAEVGIGEGFGGSPGDDDRVMHNEKYNAVIMEDGEGGPDGDYYGGIAFQFLPPREMSPQEDLNWSWLWGLGGEFPRDDDDRYAEIMTVGNVMEDQQTYTGGNKSWFSVGPFNVEVGDTLQFRMAEICGRDMEHILNDAKLAQNMDDRDFRAPSPPPLPPLRAESGHKSVTLDWSPTDEVNPEHYQAEGRGDDVEQPFEGYRVYKSTQSADGPYTLLAEYDVSGNQFGPNTGLSHTYTDRGLLNNVTYYYSVTAYSKPDTVLPWPSTESSVYQNVVEVVPGPVPPDEVGEVAAVPNPYRGDIDYNAMQPPWEPSPAGRPWMEPDRKIQFINLPPQCTIEIYSAAGDFITSISHNNPNRGYESWNLTSNVNQAVASGVYLFTVENEKTGKIQTGKFVIIK